MTIETGIQESDRKAIATGLCHLLADTYTLFLKTHNFHWNVTGPNFHSLHAMFEEQYNELFQAADTVAERIRALGHPVPASFSEFTKLASVQEATGHRAASDMIMELMKGHETIARTARGLFPAAEKGSDEATADLLTERLEVHEKQAWMLRSLLEK